MRESRRVTDRKSAREKNMSACINHNPSYRDSQQNRKHADLWKSCEGLKNKMSLGFLINLFLVRVS